MLREIFCELISHNFFSVKTLHWNFDFQIRRKRLARLAGSEPPASPPEPPKEVVPADVVEEPAPMEEDSEGQKASVTRSQSSVRMTFH